MSEQTETPDADAFDLGVTPDELVARLFSIQTEASPDDDPGDLTIDVQDDSALVAVFQKGQMVAYGGSIQEALENAVKAQGQKSDEPERRGTDA